MIHKKLVEKVMNMLLDENSEEYVKLKKQFQKAKLKEETSDVGFYINFEVDDEKDFINNKSFQIGDVYGTVDKQFASVGFVLFIKDGHLLMLEGYTNGVLDKWPDDDKIQLTYANRKKVRNNIGEDYEKNT